MSEGGGVWVAVGRGRGWDVGVVRGNYTYNVHCEKVRTSLGGAVVICILMELSVTSSPKEKC